MISRRREGMDAKRKEKKKRSVHSPKGTAPDDFSPQMNRLRTKKIQKISPGKRKAVYDYMMNVEIGC